MAKLVSVNVGMPKDVRWHGRTVHTGVWKKAVPGPQMVRRLNIDGDGQGDLAGHGGEQRAVLVYQLDSYRHWQDHFERDDLEHGAFGENLTVEGLGDDEVCIGDRYRIGEAEFEVTQPRVTCYRVGMRLGVPELASLLVAHHRPGFYMRVLTEGVVAAGDPIVRLRRGPHAMSVAEVDALLYLPHPDPARLAQAAGIAALSPGWQGSFESMLAMLEGETSGSAPAGVPTSPPPVWSGFRALTVSDVVPESASVTSFVLAADEALPAYRPGQSVAIRVTSGDGPAMVRSYSLSGDPGGGRYRISVKRETHGLVSAQLQAHVHRGDHLDVAAPRGEFVLDDSAGPVLLISAGIGLTPVLAMLHDLVDRRSSREVWWIHTARDAASHVLAAEVSGLLAELPSARSFVFYTRTGEPMAADPAVRAGRLTTETLEGIGLPVDADAYLCGPEAFMDDVARGLESIGLDSGRIHTEQFGSRTSINPGVVPAAARPPHAPDPPGAGPSVTFARSGLSTAWAERFASLLDFAEECDVPTRWSCRTGVCHTCVTAVVAGEVSYGTAPLDPPGADEVLLCVAHPTTDLVLDL